MKNPHFYEGVLLSPQHDLLPDVVGRWREGSVNVPNCKSFLVTEAERKHVRQRVRLQQHRDASSHQVFFSARQGTEGNSRHSESHIRGIYTTLCHRQKLGTPI